MPAIIEYLLKVNVAILLFCLAYYFLLRPLTFYTLNRGFLLFGLAFSAIYPLVDVAGYLQKQELSGSIEMYIINWSNVAVVQEPVTLDYWSWLLGVYWAGVVVMGIRFLTQLFSMLYIYKRSEPAVYKGLHFRKLSEKVNPFSFWQTIYLNPELHQQEELKAILEHEKVHVKQWHTLDILIADLKNVFYWFNPGMWLIKLAIRENLEFITDQKVLQNGLDSKVYQYSLIRISNLMPASPIVNNFNFLTIKRRITMMNKNQSSPMQMLKYAFLMPLVVGLIFIFTTSSCQKETNALTPAPSAPPVKSLSSDEDLKNAVHYVDGIKVDKATADKLDPNKIVTINVIKGEPAVEAFGNEAIEGVVMIVTRGNKNSEAIRELNSKLDKVGMGNHAPENAPDGRVNFGDKEMAEAVFYIDGVKSTKEEAEKLLQNDIVNVHVMKGKKAVDEFGAESEKGVVMIITKANKDTEAVRKFNKRLKDADLPPPAPVVPPVPPVNPEP